MTERRDVVIVGGGLLGTALALELASDGVDVLLLERDQINQHASGRNAGSLHFQLEYRMIEHGLEHARRAAEAIPLHLDAARRWRELGDTLGDAIGVGQRGGLMLATDNASAELLAAKVDLEQTWGLDVSLLDRAQVQELAPYLADEVVAAAFCSLEGKANARTAAPALARAALSAGASIATGTKVQAIRRTGNRWQLTSDDARRPIIEADVIILAAGVWTNELASMMGAVVPVDAVALMMTVTARTTPFTPYLLQHAGARLSLKQTAEGNVLIGGGWPAAFSPGPDGSPDLQGRGSIQRASLVGNTSAALAAVPMVANLPVIRTWVGTTTLAPDQLPVVGPLPGAPGAFVATGGSVFTLGPTFAGLLSELVQGRTPSLDLHAYAADRFERGSTPLGRAAYGAGQ